MELRLEKFAWLTGADGKEAKKRLCIWNTILQKILNTEKIAEVEGKRTVYGGPVKDYCAVRKMK